MRLRLPKGSKLFTAISYDYPDMALMKVYIGISPNIRSLPSNEKVMVKIVVSSTRRKQSEISSTNNKEENS